ncbi:carbamoyltransferase HypF [Streptosporangium sp. NPDC048047]|uniref:carbamoyltransferase HypF n=1 Tax=Streptosporangium sp. NPDC048047 TaxID=3155748 RepID=UPI003429CDB6
MGGGRRAGGRVRVAIRVEGTVQGVGFRPFVYGLATRLGLDGLVGNDERGVFIEAEGAPELVGEFTAALRDDVPPLAAVERVAVVPVPVTGRAGFAVVPSSPGGRRRALVAPDAATCADCLREMDDPADRRYGYPFVNCTNCGPRFTIVTGLPYDRPNTTMAGFAMCGDCEREYHDPADRRFHAQPVCCPACGPRLRLLGPDGRESAPPPGGLPGPPGRGGSPPPPSSAVPDRAAPGRAPSGGAVPDQAVPGGAVLEAASALLRAGAVVAVKGLGGYHLAAVAACEPAVAALRARKRREDKPFAVMAADTEAARRLCEVDEAAERLLTGASRPIVLLPRRPGARLAPPVAPGDRWLGVMLPYTPLHHLLLRRVGEPIVLTSGNLGDEPIVYDDGEAVARLGGVADAFLVHDRPIRARADDSVVRVFRGGPLPIRRSRGYAPRPLPLPRPAPRPVLACGAELKHTFCLARGGQAFVSPHVGDLENHETFRSFTEGADHLRRLLGVTPRLMAHDLHPEYLSTKYALALEDVDRTGVQHHHAHVASCLADNGVAGPVIGVAFDGLGYGADGTLWGGEFLVACLTGFERAGHLAAVPMPGGTAAVRQPWRMAAVHLDAAYAGDVPGDLAVVRRNAGRWEAVVAMARRGVNAPLTSSAGRLFDAVAALAGVRDGITYEGQAAAGLERLADEGERDGYGCGLAGGVPFTVPGSELVLAAAEDLRAGTAAGTVAARFHNGLAAAVAAGCERLREARGLGTVALSGGVFQNVLLLERTVALLEDRGFAVLTHRRVPPGDGGISLGQAAVAAARDRLG